MLDGFSELCGDRRLEWTVLPPPPTRRQELALAVQPYVTGWNRALERAPLLRTATTELATSKPKVVRIPIETPRVPVRSFVFGDQGCVAQKQQTGSSPQIDRAAPPPAAEAEPKAGQRPVGRTRIRPPQDVIKLEDRLQYLLQPSLEMVLSERSLEFPFVPFPYQMEGIAFLYVRQAAILADEMGLGKTMQAITAIRLLLRCGEIRSVLLVCPKPLVSNWRREFALWAPEIPVAIVEGDHKRRRWQWQLADVPVKIANYELMLRDRELFEGTDSSGSGALKFDLAVLDEAQRIKNRRSTTSQVACSIARSRNWALTGTPVENCAEDLVGIFEYLVPGHLSSEMKPSKMGRCVSDYILRRTKDKVLAELPPKMFRDAAIELLPEQRETYRLAEDEGVLRLSAMGEGATIQHVFELILRLKQICNFDPATGSSAKLERLEADLEEVAASGRKALVFSQWVSTLECLSERLARFGPLQYHGKIPPHRRDAVIEEFRHSPDKHVLMISYGAGGVGLNLQFSQYVFLFDRWWNPAIEDQAVNRAHRIGAAGPVTVTRFLVTDTIEERINLVLEEKRELFEMILSGADRPQNKLGLSQKEIFGLFDLQTPSGPIRYAA
ncbi:MAG: DEAD/DEAH box helicase [Thermoguttaceae bacterium]